MRSAFFWPLLRPTTGKGVAGVAGGLVQWVFTTRLKVRHFAQVAILILKTPKNWVTGQPQPCSTFNHLDKVIRLRVLPNFFLLYLEAGYNNPLMLHLV